MFGRRDGLEQLLHRPKPNTWQKFLEAPYLFLARLLYSWRQIHPAPDPPRREAIAVVCVSDTHNYQPHLPKGDVLIHAGDLTQSGSFEEMEAALGWLREQPFEFKIVVAGNHDLLLDKSVKKRSIIRANGKPWTGETLSTSKIHLQRPYTPKQGNWAFQYPRNGDIWKGQIPEDLDILITHGPPRGHLDLTYGCAHLLRELWRTRPKLHVFGHIHAGYGEACLQFDALQDAYERLVTTGGLFNLLYMLWALFWSRLQPPAVSSCLAVNAAIVGGLRDEKRREPIRVLI